MACLRALSKIFEIFLIHFIAVCGIWLSSDQEKVKVDRRPSGIMTGGGEGREGEVREGGEGEVREVV